MLMLRDLTAGELVVRWVEHWCTAPGGKPAKLTAVQRAIVYRLYDGRERVTEDEIADSGLAAFLVLHALCRPQARPGAQAPYFETDVFTLWNAAGPDLREFLVRRGEKVICPELGTVWSTAA